MDEQPEEAEEYPLVVPPPPRQYFSEGEVVSAADEMDDHVVAA